MWCAPPAIRLLVWVGAGVRTRLTCDCRALILYANVGRGADDDGDGAAADTRHVSRHMSLYRLPVCEHAHIAAQAPRQDRLQIILWELNND